ncbi:50S ribosomal protein L11 methyltransferase [Facklamia miroungae]|uniref:Ribosomal protein L11 methyltransferase n=1 Tax=Facklamia miroungae TaxID=120956 RepID=A0A1G7R0V5_9LACT|nr:50S ribosomal protein L11 methyltransferase [Facklamia miroungae]NKZ29117.1 methyltransferase [Facklamia miroungae]SDG03759.1 ribosomal protein L11 methyltransferase [Facklamia miroungae]
MTNWTQVTIYLQTKKPDQIDYASHLLFEWGAKGVQVINVEGYLENKENLFGEIPLEPSASDQRKKSRLVGFFDQAIDKHLFNNFLIDNLYFDFSWEQAPIVIENWQKNWMKNYHVQEISRFIKVVPVWENYLPQFVDEKIIYLDPGVAFGTGDHPTTQLGAQALEMVMRGGEKVYDVGTGSGVLALIAAALGAHKVEGYDLDPQAIAAAEKNLTYQKWEKAGYSQDEHPAICFQVNDLLKGVQDQANIIVANILPHILTDLYHDAYRLLEKDGYLILGGILAEKAQQVVASLPKAQWDIIQINYFKDWAGMIAQKKE